MIEDIQKWSYNNWMQIHPFIRNDCLNELNGWIPQENIDTFRQEFESGQDMGGPGFHLFGGGMQIRNRLRNALLDEELPSVIYDDGNSHKNWDDYYMGALQEFVTDYQDKKNATRKT